MLPLVGKSMAKGGLGHPAAPDLAVHLGLDKNPALVKPQGQVELLLYDNY